MTKYRRNRVEGGTYFFTVTLRDRSSSLLVKHVDLLRAAVRDVKARRPFQIDAWVVLPEHMHCVWTLPERDKDYSTRWKEIKTLFSKSLAKIEFRDPVRIKKGERGIWQRRFWEHTIRDMDDFARHVDYIHLNPCKHGLVKRVRDWPYSSFHRYVNAGIYSEDWLGDEMNVETGERRI